MRVLLSAKQQRKSDPTRLYRSSSNVIQIVQVYIFLSVEHKGNDIYEFHGEEFDFGDVKAEIAGP